MFVRPAIVLPRDAEDQEDLNRAIVHELEHVRRGDSVSRCFARVAGAVYWFHPMIWIAWRRLALEAERSEALEAAGMRPRQVRYQAALRPDRSVVNTTSEVAAHPFSHGHGSVTEPRAFASGHSQAMMTLCLAAGGSNIRRRRDALAGGVEFAAE